MSRLVAYLEARHFYFRAHCLLDPALAAIPTIILRGDAILDRSPNLDQGRSRLSYLRSAYPNLREIHWEPESYFGLYETLWSQVVPVAMAIEPLGDDRGFFEPATSRPEDLAGELRGLRERILAAAGGLEVSLGAGPSRLMARIAARAGRVVGAGDAEDFLAGAPLEWLPLEPRALERLRDLGVERVGELAEVGRGVLHRCVGGVEAPRLAALLRGRGESQVRSLYPPESLEERVFPGEEPDEARLRRLLLGAGRRLFARLDAQRRWPRELRLTLDPLQGLARDAAMPLVRPPAGPEELARRYSGLLRNLWRGEDLASATLAAGKLEPLSPAQYGFHFAARAARSQALEQVMGALQRRFGEAALYPAGKGPTHQRWAEQILAC